MTMIVSGLGGCSSKKASTVDENGEVGKSIAVLQNALEKAEDTSDLPTWQGKQLNLSIWHAHGTGGETRRISEKDVVTPEIKRVTGISFDSEKSFDNGGDVIDSKLGKVVVTRDFPDIIYIPDTTKFVEMANAGLFWDLSELLPKYCPNVLKKNLNTSVYPDIMNDINVTGGQQDKVYGLPVLGSKSVAKALNPGFDFSELEDPASEYPFIWVRDDILRMIYPNAKTQKQIEELYMKNGSFSKEELLDVPINSKEDFFAFLYKINALNIKEGSKKVETFYTHNGGDNWPLLAQFGGLFGWHVDFTRSDCNYYAYFDKLSQRVEMMYRQPFFKEALKSYNKLVRDGVASKEALIDTAPRFKEKLSNGLYATAYSISENDPAFIALNAANKPYAYRKVYLKIKQDTNRFVFTENINPSSRAGSCIAIFKDRVKKEDLPQILNFVNYKLSDQGQKLQVWGPKSAGLFKEDEQGRRIYTDPLLEADVVYNAKNDRILYYNLASSPAWPGYFNEDMNRMIYKPTKSNYPVKRQSSETNKMFNYGRIESFLIQKNCNPNYASLQGMVPEFDKFWSARQAFEASLKKVFAASDDAEFEKLYQEMISVSESNGMTQETINKIDQYYKQNVNPNYADYLK